MTEHILQYNDTAWRKRLLVSVATEGWVRYEWAAARYGQVTPVNWAASGFDINYTAIGYSIDDAYNMITSKALEMGVDWLVIIEDDVLVPNNLFVLLADYINEAKYPVVSGLYYTKGSPSEPLIFRGRGNGPYLDWTLGDKVKCDGLPMGCMLMHTSLLRWMWDNAAEDYRLCDGTPSRKVFVTPKQVWYDPESGGWQRREGTQDLYFFDRLIEHEVLSKTGWDDLAKEENPWLCDTNIFCKHIDRGSGRQYP